MRALLLLFVAVNPAAVAIGLRGRAGPALAVAAVASAAVAIALAGASSAILDALDVTPATFRLAAGAVLAAGSLWWVVMGHRPGAENDAGEEPDAPGPRILADLAYLLSPQLVAVSISLGADEGVTAVAVCATAVLAVTWVATALGSTRPAVWSALARIIGVFGVVLALDLIVDGVKSV